MKVSFKVSGLRELEASLAELKAATAKAVLRRAAITALMPMGKIAAGLAPKETGALERSIAVSAKARGAGADIGKAEFSSVMKGGGSRGEAVAAMRGARRAANGGDGVPSVEMFMGPATGSRRDAIKAVVQEFGSSKQAAQPYMRPAWDQDRSALLTRVADELRAEIDRTVARAAKRAARAAARE